MVKNPPTNEEDVRDLVSIPGSWRSPGEENGNPLQYSCLEHPTNKGAWPAQSTRSKRVGHDGSNLTCTLMYVVFLLAGFGHFSSLNYNLHEGRDFFPPVFAISLTCTSVPGTSYRVKEYRSSEYFRKITLAPMYTDSLSQHKRNRKQSFIKNVTQRLLVLYLLTSLYIFIFVTVCSQHFPAPFLSC